MQIKSTIFYYDIIAISVGGKRFLIKILHSYVSIFIRSDDY